MLTPVSFKRGRGHAPRLSKPYVPGRHADRFWSEAEIDIVRQHYAAKGPGGCLALLPGRTIAGVYNRANQLGLKKAGQSKKAAAVGTSLDDAIREAWPGMAGRGSVQALADRLGVRRHVVSTRAVRLGLTLPHKKEPRWTEEEDALLRRAPVNQPDAASAFFAAHGFKRTATSITVRCKRAGVSRRRQDVLSGHKAATILGVNSKTITSWIAAGDLVADRRGTKRLPQQGGDTFTIQPADLRKFILDQLDRIDIRKVDKHAFVAILTNA